MWYTVVMMCELRIVGHGQWENFDRMAFRQIKMNQNALVALIAIKNPIENNYRKPKVINTPHYQP